LDLSPRSLNREASRRDRAKLDLVEGVDPVKVQEDLVLANLLNGVGDVRDRIMTSVYVLVQCNIITAKSDERLRCFGGDHKAGSDGGS
jgi:hypothetical protein